jgi:vacuolar-type H+-ATPase subunit H
MNFEEAGRALDREIEKLVEFLEQKVKPATRQEMSELLRKASARLAKLADSLGKPEP